MDVNLDDVVRVKLKADGRPIERAFPIEEASQADFQVIALDTHDPPNEVCILMDKNGGFEITAGTISSLRSSGYKVSPKIDQYKSAGKMGRWIYASIIVAKTVATVSSSTSRQADYEPCVACKEPIYMGAKDATCFSCRSNPMRKYY